MTRLDDAIAALRPNDRQWEAFRVTGHCAVLAPPGSGKTRLLTTRLVYDLATNIQAPRGAACITLTNAAADELLDRFESISDDYRHNLFIGTVHSFALQRILAPFAALAGRPDLTSPTVGHRSDLSALWVEALDDAGVPASERQYLESTVSRFRVLLAPEATWDKLGRWPRIARDAFCRRMEAAAVFDFTYLINAAVAMVEEHGFVRRVLRAQFPRIYVDEYQDLAPGLDRIVQAICFKGGAEDAFLFAVGDPDQAIYGWTGSDPRLLVRLAKREGVTTVRLQRNYRSGDRIVDIAGRLFDTRRDVVASRPGGSITVQRVAGGVERQLAAAGHAISGLVDGGVPHSEIAIICRTNDQCALAVSVLGDIGMACHVRVRDSWETPLTVTVEELLAWAIAREQSGFKPGDLLAKLRRSCAGLTSQEVADTVRAFASVEPSDDAFEAVDRVLAMGVRRTEAKVARAGEFGVSALEWELRSGYLSGSSAAVFKDRRVIGNRVVATTMSACKGLEFDNVFIVDLEDGRIPFFTSFDKPAELAEERNKFYVALTRARNGAHLLWSGYTDTRYGPRPARLSRFVQSLRLDESE
jgi:DNA helicase II / ATP-dependent DNA helicase PcrA